MVTVNAPVMTVTHSDGLYEIALEEETCAMLQKHHQSNKEEETENNKIEGEEKQFCNTM